MAVFRVNKNKNYTVMSNYHFKDKNLSLKAKGLLSQMLSLPDDWDYTVAGLCAINKESGGAMNSALKELENNGYLKRTKVQNEKGRFDYIYDIYEKPYMEKPDPENPYMDNPVLENNIQLSTNKQNTKKQNTYNVSRESQEFAKKLRDKILTIYPNNVGARKSDCIDRWAKDIDKMNRLDGRSWDNISKAIDYAMNDPFWQKNIWSGANLRKHYDRLEADARADFMKHGTITVGI